MPYNIGYIYWIYWIYWRWAARRKLDFVCQFCLLLMNEATREYSFLLNMSKVTYWEISLFFSNNVIVKQEEDKGHWDELRQWLTNKILKNYHIGIFLNNVLVLFKSSLVIIRCYCHLDYRILSDYQRSSYYCVSSVKNHRGSLSARRCDFWLLSCFAFVFPGWWPNWTSQFLHFCICCHTTLPQIDCYHQKTKVHHTRHN